MAHLSIMGHILQNSLIHFVDGVSERERLGKNGFLCSGKKAARQQSSLFETSALDALELLSPRTKAIYNSNQLLDEDLWRTGDGGGGWRRGGRDPDE